MPLTDELTAATRRQGFACGLSRALAGIPDDEAAEYRDVIAAGDWSAAAISRVLVAHGHPISAQQVLAHRNGTCQTCGPKL